MQRHPQTFLTLLTRAEVVRNLTLLSQKLSQEWYFCEVFEEEREKGNVLILRQHYFK